MDGTGDAGCRSRGRVQHVNWPAQISSQTAFFNLKESKKLERVLLLSWLPWRQQQHIKEEEKEEEKIVRSTRWLSISQPN